MSAVGTPRTAREIDITTFVPDPDWRDPVNPLPAFGADVGGGEIFPSSGKSIAFEIQAVEAGGARISPIGLTADVEILSVTHARGVNNVTTRLAFPAAEFGRDLLAPETSPSSGYWLRVTAFPAPPPAGSTVIIIAKPT